MKKSNIPNILKTFNILWIPNWVSDRTRNQIKTASRRKNQNMYFALNPNPNHNYISWLILVWFFGSGEISKTKKNYIIVYIQILYKLIYFEYPTGSQIGLEIEQRPQVGEKIKYVLCPRSKPKPQLYFLVDFGLVFRIRWNI